MAFLSSIQKVSERVVRSTISGIEKSLPDFVEKDESENETKKINTTISSQENKESLNQSDFSDTVKIVLSNCVQISRK